MSIVQVARAAGVSHATVSRVINNSPGVSPESIRLVNEAMRQIGYTPPARRRGPRRKNAGVLKTGNIAMLLLFDHPTMVFAPVTAAFVHAAEQTVAERSLGLTLAQLKDGKLPPSIRPDRIDGLLLHGYPPSKEVADQLRHFPCVWVFSKRTRHGDWGDRVSPDNDAIGRTAAEHLLERGHKHLAFVNFNLFHLGIAERRDAFVAAALNANAHVEVFENKSTAVKNFDHEQEMQIDQLGTLVDDLLARDKRPTGVFVPRARRCVPMYKALRARGVQPGKDIELIACDVDPVLEGLDPQPATIDVRPEEMARRAVEHLLTRIRDPHDQVRHEMLIEPRLVLPPSP